MPSFGQSIGSQADLKRVIGEKHIVLSGRGNLENITFLSQQIKRIENTIKKQRAS